MNAAFFPKQNRCARMLIVSIESGFVTSREKENVMVITGESSLGRHSSLVAGLVISSVPFDVPDLDPEWSSLVREHLRDLRCDLCLKILVTDDNDGVLDPTHL